MTEEEAIKICRDSNQEVFNFQTGKGNSKWLEAYYTIIDSLEKKNKIIDGMAEYIAGLDIDEDICSKTECDSMAFGECERCIIEYFEKEEG